MEELHAKIRTCSSVRGIVSNGYAYSINKFHKKDIDETGRKGYGIV